MSFALPLVMGHRGAAAWAPENTLASIRRAAELGATWVEFDVMLTGDGTPVLFHDDNLKRITGLDALMAETPFAEVQTLDAGRWFAPEFAGERIPTLEAALGLARDLDMDVNLEIKSTPGRDVETAEVALKAAAVFYGRRRRVPMISSFSRMSLAAARVLRPTWPRGLVAHKVPVDWRLALTALGCVSFHVNGNRLSEAFVAEIKGAGYKVAAFTVNQRQRARDLVRCDVDCLITDAPDRIAAAVARAGEDSAAVG